MEDSEASLNDYKVVILGKATVGKSCISIRFMNNSFSPEYIPTLQDKFQKKILVDNEIASLGLLKFSFPFILFSYLGYCWRR